MAQFQKANSHSAFLIFVMVLQILPVRQAVKYFLIDNQTVEEILHLEKSATKNFRLLDEDHKYMPEQFYIPNYAANSTKNYPLHSSVTIPPFHTADIVTPPPNKI